MAQNEQTTEEHSTLEQQSPGRLDHPAWCVVWTEKSAASKDGRGKCSGGKCSGGKCPTLGEREGEEEGLGSSGSRSGETSIAGRITTAAAQRQEEGKRSDELSAAETQSPTSTHARTFAASPDTCPP